MSRLSKPCSIFVSNNEIFICDRDTHSVKKILSSGQLVTICGTGKNGHNGDHKPAPLCQLNHPVSVVVSCRDEVYISEREGNCIRKILTNGNLITVAGETWNIEDDRQAKSHRLDNPCGIFVTDLEEIYVAEYLSNCVKKVTKNGNVMLIAGTGKEGYNGDGILALNAQLNGPAAVFVTPSNQVFICEQYGHRIRKIDRNGIISTIAGTGKGGFNGDEMPATKAQLSFPSGIYVTEDNDNEIVYIADFYNDRVRKVQNGMMTTVAGSGTGHLDNSMATDVYLQGPSSVFVHEGIIYISEQNGGRIRKIDRKGRISKVKMVDGGAGVFDIEKYPHVGPKKAVKIPQFSKAFHDMDIKTN